jgi:hypothetical protein
MRIGEKVGPAMASLTVAIVADESASAIVCGIVMDLAETAVFARQRTSSKSMYK